MFLLRGGGGQAVASGAPEEIQKLIQEKDEEISHLEAHVRALQEQMNKDMDDFEQVSIEKNKVIAEQQSIIEELRAGNNTQAAPLMPHQDAAEKDAGEAVSALREQLERADAEILLLREANAMLQQQAPGIEDASKAREENLELRERLKDAILQMQGSMMADGKSTSMTSTEIELVLAEGEHVDAFFASRDKRKLGCGWPVAQVRDGSWAQRSGLQEGDELHGVDGIQIEALPEAEVMELLCKRPLSTTTWIRRTVVQAPCNDEQLETTPMGTAAEAGESETILLLQQQQQVAQEQLRQAAEEVQVLRALLEAKETSSIDASSTEEATALVLRVSEEEEKTRQALEEVAHLRAELQSNAVNVEALQELESLRVANMELVTLREEVGSLRAIVANANTRGMIEDVALQPASGAQQSALEDPESILGKDGWGDEFDLDIETSATKPVSTESIETEDKVLAHSDTAQHLEDERQKVAELLAEVARLRDAQRQETEIAEIETLRVAKEHSEEESRKLAEELAQLRIELASTVASRAEALQKEEADAMVELSTLREEVVLLREAAAKPKETPPISEDTGAIDIDLNEDTDKEPTFDELRQRLAEQEKLSADASALVAQLESEASTQVSRLEEEKEMLRKHLETSSDELQATRAQVASLNQEVATLREESSKQKPALESHYIGDDSSMWGDDLDLDIDTTAAPDSIDLTDARHESMSSIGTDIREVPPSAATEPSTAPGLVDCARTAAARTAQEDLWQQLEDEQRRADSLLSEVELLKAQKQDAEAAANIFAQDAQSLKLVKQELVELQSSKERTEQGASEALRALQEEIAVLKQSQTSHPLESIVPDVAAEAGWGDFDLELDGTGEKGKTQDTNAVLPNTLEEWERAQMELASLRQENATLREESATLRQQASANSETKADTGNTEGAWDDIDLDLDVGGDQNTETVAPPEDNGKTTNGDSEVLRQLEDEQRKYSELLAVVEQMKISKEDDAMALAQEEESLKLAYEEIAELHQSKEKSSEDLKSAQEQLLTLRQEMNMLREESAKQLAPMDAPPPEEVGGSSENAWGDDFDFDLEGTGGSDIPAPKSIVATSDSEEILRQLSEKNADLFAEVEQLKASKEQELQAATQALAQEVEALRLAREEDKEMHSSKEKSFEEELRCAQAELVKLTEANATHEKASEELQTAQEQLFTLRQEMEMLREESAKQAAPVVAPPTEDARKTSGDGWGDEFDFDLEGTGGSDIPAPKNTVAASDSDYTLRQLSEKNADLVAEVEQLKASKEQELQAAMQGLAQEVEALRLAREEDKEMHSSKEKTLSDELHCAQAELANLTEENTTLKAESAKQQELSVAQTPPAEAPNSGDGWGDDFDFDVDTSNVSTDVKGGGETGNDSVDTSAILRQLEEEQRRYADLFAEVEQLKAVRQQDLETAASALAQETESLRLAKDEIAMLHASKDMSVEELRCSQDELGNLQREVAALREERSKPTEPLVCQPLAESEKVQVGDSGWGDDFDFDLEGPPTNNAPAEVSKAPEAGADSTDGGWGDFDLDVDAAVDPASDTKVPTDHPDKPDQGDALKQLEEEQKRYAQLLAEMEQLKASQQRGSENAAIALAQETESAKQAKEQLVELQSSKDQSDRDLRLAQDELNALRSSQSSIDVQQPPEISAVDGTGWGDFDEFELDEPGKQTTIQDTSSQVEEDRQKYADLLAELETAKAARAQEAEVAEKAIAQKEEALRLAMEQLAELTSSKERSEQEAAEALELVQAELAACKEPQQDEGDAGWGDFDLELDSEKKSETRDEAIEEERRKNAELLESIEKLKAAQTHETEEAANAIAKEAESTRLAKEELAQCLAAKERSEQEAAEALRLVQEELAALRSVQKDNISQETSSANNAADDGGWGDFDLELDEPGDKKNKQDSSASLEKKTEESQLAQTEIARLRQELATLQEASAKQNMTSSKSDNEKAGEEGWADDFDFDLDVVPGSTPEAPQVSGAVANSEVTQQLENEKKRCAELLAEVDQLKDDQKKNCEAAAAAIAREAESSRLAKEELAEKEKKNDELQLAQTEIASLRQELATLQEASAKQNTSSSKSDNEKTGEEGWADDFDFDLDVEPQPSKESGAAANGNISQQLDDEQRRSAELLAEVERLKAAQKNDAETAASQLAQETESLNLAKQEVAQLQNAKEASTQELDSKAEAMRDMEEELVRLRVSQDELDALKKELATLREEVCKQNEAAEKAVVAPGAEVADDDGWGDFDLPDEIAPEAVTTSIPGDTGSAQPQEDAALLEAQKESLRLREVLRQSEEHAENLQKEIVALAASSQPTPSSGSKAEAPPKDATDDAGWDDFDDFVDESDAKPDASHAVAENAELKAKIESLTAQLIVASGRVKHAEDEKLAEQRAHSPQATGALRTEVAKLTEALVAERQERQNEEVHLRQLVRQAQEDLRQHRVLSEEADTTALLDQISALRKQRDQARSIAQCIARQTSTLAEEIYRLRTNGLPSNSGSGALVSATSEEEAHPPAAEAEPTNVEATRDRREEPEEQRRDNTNFVGSFLGGLGAAFSGFIEREVAEPREGVETQHPPRPPDEVTSGWDVFDPDDQIENTEPTAPAVGITSGWGDDDGDLFEGFPDPVDAATADLPPGHPPELSSMSSSPPAATSGIVEAGSTEDDFWSDLM